MTILSRNSTIGIPWVSKVYSLGHINSTLTCHKTLSIYDKASMGKSYTNAAYKICQQKYRMYEIG